MMWRTRLAASLALLCALAATCLPRQGSEGFHRFAPANGPFSFDVVEDLKPTAGEPDVREWMSVRPECQIAARIINEHKTETEKTAAEYTASLNQDNKDAKDFKATTLPYVVNGVFGRLVKATFKSAGVTNYRDCLLIGTAQALYVLEVGASNEAVADHVIGSATLTMPRIANELVETGFKGSDLRVLTFPGSESTSSGPEDPLESTETVQYIAKSGAVVMSSIFEVYKPDAPMSLDTIMGLTVSEIAKAAGAEVKVLNQGFGVEKEGRGYWVAYTLKLPETSVECYVIGVHRGHTLLIQNVALLTKDEQIRSLAQQAMNSYRLFDK
ncbi:MAG: hypothetical protein JSS72_02310 [Armatimonadetes bacterium]|nr:hypothetical protein [Armatimonadota bacterium]